MTAEIERLINELTSPPPADDEPASADPGERPATADEVEDGEDPEP